MKPPGGLGRLHGVGRGADDPELAEFCRTEWPRLVGSIGLYLGRRDVAEDLAQEALIRVCGHWNEVRITDSPSAGSGACGRSIELAPEPQPGGAVSIPTTRATDAIDVTFQRFVFRDGGRVFLAQIVGVGDESTAAPGIREAREILNTFRAVPVAPSAAATTSLPATTTETFVISAPIDEPVP